MDMEGQHIEERKVHFLTDHLSDQQLENIRIVSNARGGAPGGDQMLLDVSGEFGGVNRSQ